MILETLVQYLVDNSASWLVDETIDLGQQNVLSVVRDTPDDQLLVPVPIMAVIGVNIFAHYMPETIQDGAMLRFGYNEPKVDHDVANFYTGSVQLIVRSVDFATGQSKTERIKQLLTLQDVNISNVYGSMIVRNLFPRHLPYSYPRTEGNILEFSVNFDAAFIV